MTGRPLTPQERALWRRVSKSAVPLRKARHAEPVIADRPTKKAAEPKLRLGAKAPTAASPTTRKPDPFASGDPKMDRLAQRGRIPIEGVFDLHGHNQASARAALYGFILAARAQKKRCVLIITGKGETGLGHSRAGERGILRRRFQEWVGEDDFHQHIVRASPAHARHGGSGAFYVFLKRSAQ